jgi:hypothetical protein
MSTARARPTGWSRNGPARLTPTALERLVRNELPCIIVADFATPAECAALVDAANKIGFSPYEQISPPIDRIGVTAFEYDRGHKDMKQYFADAREAQKVQEQIFRASFDPVERFMNAIRQQGEHRIDVAHDPQHGRYHAGLVRRIEQGTLLHVDFAPFEQPAWHVGSIQAQLTWNLYVEASETDPGVTHVYNRPIVAEDQRYKVADTYGYERETVRSAEKITYWPRLGDLWLFNTRNFHQVDPTRARRTACTSQIGVVGPRELVIWS